MDAQVKMKDAILEMFGDCFGNVEQTRWAIARQRIRRVCKVAQMMGYIYGSNEETYLKLYYAIEGEITIAKVVDALNATIRYNKPKIDVADSITMESLRDYCRMDDAEFKKAFKTLEGYEYTE